MENKKYSKKILGRKIQSILVNGENVKVTTIFWCYLDSVNETKTTIKTDYIAKTVYFTGKSQKSYSVKRCGIDILRGFKGKLLSLKKSNLFASLVAIDEKQSLRFVNPRRCDASCEAYLKYMIDSDLQSKNVTGKVRFFDKNRGEGMVTVGDHSFDVYACNFKGAKTGYPATACMYLVEGENVDGDLIDLGGRLSMIVTKGAYFDEVKWDSLDQDRLAFKKNDDGTYKNGLFAKGAGF